MNNIIPFNGYVAGNEHLLHGSIGYILREEDDCFLNLKEVELPWIGKAVYGIRHMNVSRELGTYVPDNKKKVTHTYGYSETVILYGIFKKTESGEIDTNYMPLGLNVLASMLDINTSSLNWHGQFEEIVKTALAKMKSTRMPKEGTNMACSAGTPSSLIR